MFQLEPQIRAWRQSLQARGLRDRERIDELEDHLYCEIERLLDQGLSEEGAFRAAIQQVGEAEALSTEYQKIELQKGHKMNPGKSAVIIIAHALLHAAAILLANYLLRDTPHDQTVTYLITSLWFASYMLLLADQRSIGCELRAVQRMFRSLRNG